MKYLRRWRPSKRRWIARYMLGLPIPSEVLPEYPKLSRRIKGADYLPHMDVFLRPEAA